MEEADYGDYLLDTSILSNADSHWIPPENDDVEDLIFPADDPTGDAASEEHKRPSLTSLENPILDSLLETPVNHRESIGREDVPISSSSLVTQEGLEFPDKVESLTQDLPRKRSDSLVQFTDLLDAKTNPDCDVTIEAIEKSQSLTSESKEEPHHVLLPHVSPIESEHASLLETDNILLMLQRQASEEGNVKRKDNTKQELDVKRGNCIEQKLSPVTIEESVSLKTEDGLYLANLSFSDSKEDNNKRVVSPIKFEQSTVVETLGGALSKSPNGDHFQRSEWQEEVGLEDDVKHKGQEQTKCIQYKELASKYTNIGIVENETVCPDSVNDPFKLEYIFPSHVCVYPNIFPKIEIIPETNQTSQKNITYPIEQPKEEESESLNWKTPSTSKTRDESSSLSNEVAFETGENMEFQLEYSGESSSSSEDALESIDDVQSPSSESEKLSLPKGNMENPKVPRKRGGKTTEAKKDKSPRGEKRKSKSSLHRKNIKKIMTDEDLNPEVIAARKEEEERVQRQNQAVADFKKKQDEERKVKQEQKQFEEICLSSDDECDVKEAREELIDLCDDDDEVCLSPTQQDDESEVLDMNNCGIFTDDKYNCPDSEGRILINVGHPEEEEDIFLPPHLARVVKPHQIGGIRFMYANVVESRKKFETSAGVGCILAHSMGLGKTLQVIALTEVFLSMMTSKKVLILVPINTIQNWVSEFDAWTPAQPTLNDAWNGHSQDNQYRKFKVFVTTDCKNLLSRSKEILSWKQCGGVLLMGYEMYRIIVLDSEKNKKKALADQDHARLVTRLKEALVDPGPDLVICDEGHRIKNGASFAAQALKNIKTRRRIVLTGYPVQNNLMEYWCMIDFVRPNYLGSDKEFSNMFDKPIRNGQCIDATLFDKQQMKMKSHVLFKLLAGFVQRRSHSILKGCLPLKFEHVFMTKMTELQKKLMIAFLDYLRNRHRGNNAPVFNPIVMYSVCTKIWNHPDILYRIVMEGNVLDLEDDFDVEGLPSNSSKKKRVIQGAASSSSVSANPLNFSTIPSTAVVPPKERILDYSWAQDILEGYVPGLVENSVKMVLLFDLIDKIVEGEEKLLVFSQSLFTLNLIEQFLKERTLPRSNDRWIKCLNYHRLDGSTSAQDRERFVKHFNRDESVKLFLLSTRAGSLGINLIGANRIIIFDASWNPCHDAQAACRIYRYGQEKPCFIYRLVCDYSLEKKIYDRQVNKQGMSNRVVDELNPETRYTVDELTSLISGLEDIEETPLLEVSDKFLVECPDPIVVDLCVTRKDLITKEPFEHESLLLDDKSNKLSKHEKEMAMRYYQNEKRNGGYNGNSHHTLLPNPSTNYINSRSRHQQNSNALLPTPGGYNPFRASSTMPNPNSLFLSHNFHPHNGLNLSVADINGIQPQNMNRLWNPSVLPVNVTNYPTVDPLMAQQLKLNQTRMALIERGFVDDKLITLRSPINLVDKTTNHPTIIPSGQDVYTFRNVRDGSRVLVTKDSKIVDIKKAATGSVLPQIHSQLTSNRIEVSTIS